MDAASDASQQLTLTIAELEARKGQEVGLSPWLLVDQKRIDAFAEVTGDHQFIHVDPEAAKTQTPFGGTIAHGFLTLSLLSRMAMDALPQVAGRVMGINYGFEKIRFLSPVVSGSRIRGRFHLIEVIRRSETEALTRHHVTVEIEGREKPALVAEWLGLSILA
jgi:acyl dehydratase